MLHLIWITGWNRLDDYIQFSFFFVKSDPIVVVNRLSNNSLGDSNGVKKSVKFVVVPLSEVFVHGNFCLDPGAFNNLLTRILSNLEICHWSLLHCQITLLLFCNLLKFAVYGPRSIYQNSHMLPKLSAKPLYSVLFSSYIKFLMESTRQRNLRIFVILSRKFRGQDRILMHRP